MVPTLNMKVTWHTQDVDVSGTVTHIASTGTLFWFRCDGRDVVCRAVRFPGGEWREDHHCWPVTLGTGIAGARPVRQSASPLDERLSQIERHEPWLLKRRWYPMTYMLIPSVLSSARKLAEELEGWASDSAEERQRAREGAARIRCLISEFRREP